MSRVPPPRAAGAHNNWHTPAHIIERARCAMGSIELDPASSEAANQTVQAQRIYTKEDDGLRQCWQAESVWLNPPYGRDPITHKGNMDIWTDKLIEEYSIGHVRQAIALVTAVPDRQWWRKLWQFPLCFFHKQLMFSVEGGGQQHHPYGSCLAYLGRSTDDVQRFAMLMSSIGTIVLPPTIAPTEGKTHGQYQHL